MPWVSLEGFLHKDIEVWLQDSDYGAEFIDHLTRNEKQKQFLLHVVSQHQKLCPDSKKSTVISALKQSTNSVFIHF